MQKGLKVLLIIVLSAALILTGCPAPDDPAPGEEVAPGEERGEIVFGVTPWSTTIPPTYIAAVLLEDMGYEVTLQDADVGLVYSALATGDIDVFMDSWLPDMHASYMAEFGDRIEQLSVSYTEGELGWVVPEYVEEVNSIEELNEHRDLFDGQIIGIDEGAGMTETSREMIDAYNLDYEYIASSEAAMLSQAATAIAQERPILFLGYRPHSMFAMWDLKFLDDPLGFWEASEVHVLGTMGLAERAPEAHQFLSNWSIPIDDLEEMILQIDEEGADPEQLAREWIEENEDLVNEMLGEGAVAPDEDAEVEDEDEGAEADEMEDADVDEIEDEEE